MLMFYFWMASFILPMVYPGTSYVWSTWSLGLIPFGD
jgi:hypothetical protein